MDELAVDVNDQIAISFVESLEMKFNLETRKPGRRNLILFLDSCFQINAAVAGKKAAHNHDGSVARFHAAGPAVRSCVRDKVESRSNVLLPVYEYFAQIPSVSRGSLGATGGRPGTQIPPGARSVPRGPSQRARVRSRFGAHSGSHSPASLHTLPGDPAAPRAPCFWPLAETEAITAVRDRTIRQADLILAVYALPSFLTSNGKERREPRLFITRLASRSRMSNRTTICRGLFARSASVVRSQAGDPSVILEALATLPQVDLTLVGDGALGRDVASLAARLGVESCLKVIPAIPNDALVASLGTYDLFLARNDYQGMPKAVLEPMLVGLPVIVNRPTGLVPELSNERCVLVEATAEGYRSAVERMLADRNARESVGRNAREWAWGALSPQRVEARVAELYDELIGTSTSV